MGSAPRPAKRHDISILLCSSMKRRSPVSASMYTLSVAINLSISMPCWSVRACVYVSYTAICCSSGMSPYLLIERVRIICRRLLAMWLTSSVLESQIIGRTLVGQCTFSGCRSPLLDLWWDTHISTRSLNGSISGMSSQKLLRFWMSLRKLDCFFGLRDPVSVSDEVSSVWSSLPVDIPDTGSAISGLGARSCAWSFAVVIFSYLIW